MTIEIDSIWVILFAAVVWVVIVLIHKNNKKQLQAEKEKYVKDYLSLTYPIVTPMNKMIDLIGILLDNENLSIDEKNVLLKLYAATPQLKLEEYQIICDAYDSGYDAVWYNETTNGSFYYNNNFKSQYAEKK